LFSVQNACSIESYPFSILSLFTHPFTLSSMTTKDLDTYMYKGLLVPQNDN